MSAPGAPDIAGYRILKELSSGGQGVVYEAIQQSTRRRVAVKLIRGGAQAHPEHRARIERGIRILGQLNHPNIVGIIDSGTVSGALYYIMQFVSGKPLDEYIAAQRSTSFEITPASDSNGSSAPRGTKSRKPAVDTSRGQRQLVRRQLTLIAKTCEAIDAAHVRGVIHRDLKPANILVDDRGEPHILDFDLAKILGGDLYDDDRIAHTQSGEFLGSLRWASPEQVERKPNAIDLRTDVYSIGVVLYEVLTGQYPYPVVGTRREIEDNILFAEPVRPRLIRSLIDDELETIVLKCLAKEPVRRYRSAGELAFDLRSYMNGEAIAAKRDSALYVLRKLARRHSGATVTIACVLAILVSSLTYVVFAYRNALEEKDRADSLARQASLREGQFERRALKAVELNTSLQRRIKELESQAGAGPNGNEKRSHAADHRSGGSP